MFLSHVMSRIFLLDHDSCSVTVCFHFVSCFFSDFDRAMHMDKTVSPGIVAGLFFFFRCI